MDDGGRVPERGMSAEVGVPFVVAEQVAGGGLGLLVIALFACVKASLPRVLRIAAWLLRGRERAERRLVAAGMAPALSLSPRIAGLLARAAAEGRPVYIASRRCSPLLQAVASLHPGLAGLVVAPRGLAGRKGVAQMLERFPAGYDAVLRRGGAVRIVWNAPAGGVSRRLTADAEDAASELDLSRVSLVAELARSLRLHQCVKNVVVLVPLVLSGRFMIVNEIIDTLVAFIALSCVAAGTYVLNDIWDVADDRAHWSKKERPVASGRLSAATALAFALVLIPAGLALAALVSWRTCAVLLGYLGLTLAYSLYLKTVPFLDGLTLAALFTIRLGIGVVATEAPPSPWLFVFSMFLFGSLSYAKRYTEISRAILNKTYALNGRGYRAVDAPMVLTVGLAAGVGAVLIMVLYIVEEAFLKSFYGATQWLWGFPPLVFLFIVRIWLVTVRGEMTDDPVAFAVKDRASIGLLGLLLICFGFALAG
jgi:4-hydroxybenzoate polyprenyltransferase